MTKDQLERFSSPLSSVDPTRSDVSDLAPFRDIIGKARVASVGESAHCIRESYLIKDRLFRYLVKELGFTAFVLESGFPEALAVNEWILGGPGDIETLTPSGICYSFDTEELRDQLRWMRQWNATHDRKVRFYGLDVAGSGTSPHAGIAACLKRLEPRAGDAELLESARLGRRFEVKYAYADKSPEERAALWAGVAALKDRAIAQGDEIALRSALAVQVLRTMLEDNPMPPHESGSNPRDAFMADSVRWILEREDRVMISAHNAHISRGTALHSPMMGEVLARKLGDDMVVIGTTYASGLVPKVDIQSDPGNFLISLAELPPPPAGTLDAVMNAVASDLHVVDIRRVPDQELACSMLAFYDAWPADPRGFDALIHLRHVTTSDECTASIQHETECGRAAKRLRSERS